MRLIDAGELKTAFPCGESVRTECVRATIDNMPTIEERKKGKWVAGGYCDFIICSNCGEEAYWDTDYGQQMFNYCPYCGADMRG